jgi:hypothetical protein
MFGISALTFCEVATAAKMTREQAQIACRNEVPRVPKGDRGGSRGLNTGNPAMQDCIKAKMSGK